METYVTSRCSAANHPEITLQFAERRLVPIERLLLGYFEKSVASGKRFRPGETVQVGWATFRLCMRADGTLGVEEPEEDSWVERCDRSLMQLWLQKEIVASVGLTSRIGFPRQHDVAVACEQVLASSSFVLARSEPRDEMDSGWFIGCQSEPPHDHQDPHALFAGPLVQIVHHLPFLAQFLALPPGTTVVVLGSTTGIRATIFVDGVELSPREGSYLAALNA